MTDQETPRRSLFKTDEGNRTSDLIIKCGSDIYKVHEAVVSPRMGFVAGAMRFSVGKEAADRKIDLSEDDPEAIALLIRYLYTDDYGPPLLPPIMAKFLEISRRVMRLSDHIYDDSPHWNNRLSHQGRRQGDENDSSNIRYCQNTNGRQPPETLLLHSKMYQIGDMYDVKGLKELSLDKFALACAKHWDSAAFTDAARHVYSSTLESDRGMRDEAKECIIKHLADTDVRELLEESSDITLDVLDSVMKELRANRAKLDLLENLRFIAHRRLNMWLQRHDY